MIKFRFLKYSILLVVVSSALFGCGNNNVSIITHVKEVSFPEFGNVNFDVTQKEMEDAGFHFNDLIDIKFSGVKAVSNAGLETFEFDDKETYTFKNVPFVTDYFQCGAYVPCLCNYGGGNERFEISFGLNNLKNEAYQLKERKTEVTFTMSKKGGFADVVNILGSPSKFTFEEANRDISRFANVRDVTIIGDISKHIKVNTLIRGSSPFYPKKNYNNDGRHIYADAFLDYFDVTHEVSLSVEDDFINANNDDEGYYTIAHLMKDLGKGNCLKTKEIYGFDDEKQDDSIIGANSFDNEECVSPKFITRGLGSDFYGDTGDNDDECKNMTRDIFRFIAKAKNNDGSNPVIYIHCDEGKDRTGFFLMVLEALCGVNLNDIVADFMLSFKNYFGYNVENLNNSIPYRQIVKQTICRYILAIISEHPSSIDWGGIDAIEELKTKYQIDIDKDKDYGPDLQRHAKNYINRLFDGDEIDNSEDIISDILNNIALVS